MRKATLFCLSLLVFGCKFYSFTGASIPENLIETLFMEIVSPSITLKFRVDELFL